MDRVVLGRMPVRDVRFADHGEVESADFPPGPVGVPHDPEIDFLDIVIGDAARNLNTELVGARAAEAKAQRPQQGALRELGFARRFFSFA